VKIFVGYSDGEATTGEILARYPLALEIRATQPRQHQKILDDWENLVELIDNGQSRELAPYKLAVDTCQSSDNRLALLLQRDSVETKTRSHIRAGLQRFEMEVEQAQANHIANLEFSARDYHFAVA